MENNIDRGFSLGTSVLIIIRRWWIVVGVFMICIFGGAWAYLRQPEQPFPHTTIIEIGASDEILVESIESTLAKVERVYIRRALLEHAQANEYEENRYQIRVTIPDATNVIELEAFGTLDESEDILGIEARVSELLIADHEKKSEQNRVVQLAELYTQQLIIDRLEGEVEILERQRNDILALDALLQEQIDVIAASIAASQEQRAVLLSAEGSRSASDASLATALLVIDNDIQAQRERQQNLEQRRGSDIKNLLADIDLQILGIEQEQSTAQRSVADIQFMIDSTSVTRYILEPSRQLQTGQHGPFVYLLLAGLLGVLAGIFIALLVDVVVRARHSLRLVK